VYVSTLEKAPPLISNLDDGRHIEVTHHDSYKSFRYLGVEMTAAMTWRAQRAILESTVNRMNNALGIKSLTSAEAVYIPARASTRTSCIAPLPAALPKTR
jgi:hypothetical protein